MADNKKTDQGPITKGKGLDALDGFIIRNWAPPTRFGIWSQHLGALSMPKMSLEHFLNDALKASWMDQGSGAVITIDPPNGELVTISVENEIKHWTPESKYNPKHWLWKIVPLEKALGAMDLALNASLPPAEAAYLRGLRDGKLREAWDAFKATQAPATS